MSAYYIPYRPRKGTPEQLERRKWRRTIERKRSQNHDRKAKVEERFGKNNE